MTSIKRLPTPLQLSVLIAGGTLLIALIQLFFMVRFLVSMQTVVVGSEFALPYASLAGRLLIAGLACLVLVAILRWTPRTAARLTLILFVALVVLLAANVAAMLIEQSGPHALPQAGLVIFLLTRTFWIGCLFWIGFDLRKLASMPSGVAT